MPIELAFILFTAEQMFTRSRGIKKLIFINNKYVRTLQHISTYLLKVSYFLSKGYCYLGILCTYITTYNEHGFNEYENL